MTPITLKGSNEASYTDEQVKAWGTALRMKHRAPSQKQRTKFSDKKSGNDVLIWNLPTGKLTLTAIAINGSLSLSNDEMEADVRARSTNCCASINSPGHVVGH